MEAVSIVEVMKLDCAAAYGGDRRMVVMRISCAWTRRDLRPGPNTFPHPDSSGALCCFTRYEDPLDRMRSCRRTDEVKLAVRRCWCPQPVGDAN